MLNRVVVAVLVSVSVAASTKRSGYQSIVETVLYNYNAKVPPFPDTVGPNDVVMRLLANSADKVLFIISQPEWPLQAKTIVNTEMSLFRRETRPMILSCGTI